MTPWARRSPPTARAGPRLRDCAGKLAETTLQRWQQIHALLDAGVGLLDCSRRLGLAMNSVKRYARVATPDRIQRVPKYRACERLEGLAAACPEMTALTGVVRSFAALLAPHKDNPARLAAWITAAREADLPHVHSFARGIDQDTDAVTLNHHNGRTEGVNTKTKLLKRQMYGRAGLALLRHRILLG